MVFNFIFILIELSWFLNLNHEFNKLIQVNFLYRVAFLWKEFYSLFFNIIIIIIIIIKKESSSLWRSAQVAIRTC